jgi:hypothetical protein
MCVTCCPTGIDIRNGLQMECVQCTQCIDACDSVMTKLKMPTGLIRYGSQAVIGGEATKMVRPRVIIYPTLLLILITAFSLVLLTRGTADATMLRAPGAPFFKVSEDLVGNQVKIKIANLSETPATYSFRFAEIDGQDPAAGTIRSEDNPITIAGGETKTVPVLLVMPLSAFTHGELRVKIAVTDGKDFSTSIPFRLLGPGSIHNKAARSEDSSDESDDDKPSRAEQDRESEHAPADKAPHNDAPHNDTQEDPR